MCKRVVAERLHAAAEAQVRLDMKNEHWTKCLKVCSVTDGQRELQNLPANQANQIQMDRVEGFWVGSVFINAQSN